MKIKIKITIIALVALLSGFSLFKIGFFDLTSKFWSFLGPSGPFIYSKRYQLEQIKLKSDISGHLSGMFILVAGGITGDIKTEPIFYFYTMDDDGSIKLRKVPCNNVVIHYSNEAHAIYRRMVYTNLDSERIEDMADGKFSSYYGSSIWEIYIPEGSITNEYDINISQGIRNIGE